MNLDWNNDKRECAISNGFGAIGCLAGSFLGSPFGAIPGTAIGATAGLIFAQQIANPHLFKILEHKMSSDFENSFLLDRSRFYREMEDLSDRRVEAHRWNWTINLDNYLYFNLIEPWDFQTLSDPDQIRKFEILANIEPPLSISVSSVNAGVMATLMSLNQKFKSHCGFDLINIDYSSVNGIEQIQTINNKVKKHDFLITPCDSFILSPGNGINIYRSLGPINWHTQSIFFKKRRRVDFYHNRFIAFPASSVEMQHHLKIGIPERIEIEYLDEKRNFIEILKSMGDGDHISMWEPLASIIRATEKDFEEIKMPEYKVVFHLFAQDCWFDSDLGRARIAFQSLFQNEWRICKTNQKNSLTLLKSNREYIRNFAIGSGL